MGPRFPCHFRRDVHSHRFPRHCRERRSPPLCRPSALRAPRRCRSDPPCGARPRIAAARPWRRRSRHRNEPGRRRDARDGLPRESASNSSTTTSWFLADFRSMRDARVWAGGGQRPALSTDCPHGPEGSSTNPRDRVGRGSSRRMPRTPLIPFLRVQVRLTHMSITQIERNRPKPWRRSQVRPGEAAFGLAGGGPDLGCREAERLRLPLPARPGRCRAWPPGSAAPPSPPGGDCPSTPPCRVRTWRLRSPPGASTRRR